MKRFLLRFTPLLGLSLTTTVGSGLQQIDKYSVYSLFSVQSQTTEKPAASITGHIFVGGNPAPNVTVTLLGRDSNGSRHATVEDTKTDEDGRYQFKGLAPGRYDIYPYALELVLPKEDRYGQPRKTVVVEEEAAAVEGVDFIVVLGGIVTGRVTNADGRPLVGEAMTLNEIGEQGDLRPFHSPSCNPRDR